MVSSDWPLGSRSSHSDFPRAGPSRHPSYWSLHAIPLAGPVLVLHALLDRCILLAGSARQTFLVLGLHRDAIPEGLCKVWVAGSGHPSVQPHTGNLDTHCVQPLDTPNFQPLDKTLPRPLSCTGSQDTHGGQTLPHKRTVGGPCWSSVGHLTAGGSNVVLENFGAGGAGEESACSPGAQVTSGRCQLAACRAFLIPSRDSHEAHEALPHTYGLGSDGLPHTDSLPHTACHTQPATNRQPATHWRVLGSKPSRSESHQSPSRGSESSHGVSCRSRPRRAAVHWHAMASAGWHHCVSLQHSLQ